MRENKCLWKGAVVTIILLFIGISILPSTIGISEFKKPKVNTIDGGEFDLSVSVKPIRKIFPRFYSANFNMIGFHIDVNNNGPDNSTEGIVEFEIIKVFGKEPGVVHNETIPFDSMWKGRGRGYLIPWYSWMYGHFGVFEARATINVDDIDLKNNMKTFYFILLS